MLDRSIHYLFSNSIYLIDNHILSPVACSALIKMISSSLNPKDDATLDESFLVACITSLCEDSVAGDSGFFCLKLTDVA